MPFDRIGLSVILLGILFGPELFGWIRLSAVFYFKESGFVFTCPQQRFDIFT